MSGLLYADDLVLNGESEEDLRVMKKPFVEIYERKVLKINAHKSKVMVWGGEEGSACEIMEYVSEHKNWGVVQKSEYCRKVTGSIRSLVMLEIYNLNVQGYGMKLGLRQS